MGSATEAEQVEETGETANTSTKVSVVTNVVINVVLAGSLNKVWDMIEGLQICYHLPLFKVKSPGNVNAFNNFFEEIGGFQLIDVSVYTEDIVYYPEMDAMTLNFQNAGLWNPFSASNLGLLIFMFAGHFIFLPFVLALIWCGKKNRKVKLLSDKAEDYMFWSGSMRFFTEGYLDFCMFSLLNIKYLDWSDTFPIVTFCNYIAISITVLAISMPVFVLVWYAWSVKRWKDESF